MQIFFTAAIGPAILMNILEAFFAFFSSFEPPRFFKNFIVSKNIGFQSGALLKLPLSSPSMEKFGLDIQE